MVKFLFKKYTSLLAPLTALLILSIILSCTKKKAASIAETIFIQGVVQLGPVSGAQVSIYEAFADGTRGELLGTATTNGWGQYDANIENRQNAPFLVAEAEGGVFIDEATGSEVENNETFNSLVAADSDTKELPVTPATQFVFERALRNRENGSSMEEVLNKAKSEVAELLGLPSGEDLFKNPTHPEDPKSASNPADRHAMALTALSRFLNSENIEANISPRVYKSLSAYFGSKGKLDVGSNPTTFANRISQSYALDTNSDEVEQFMTNPTHLPVSQFDFSSDTSDFSSDTSDFSSDTYGSDPSSDIYGSDFSSDIYGSDPSSDMNGSDFSSDNSEGLVSDTDASPDNTDPAGGNNDPNPNNPPPPPPPPTTCSGPYGKANTCPAGTESAMFCPVGQSLFGICTGPLTKMCLPKDSSCTPPSGTFRYD